MKKFKILYTVIKAESNIKQFRHKCLQKQQRTLSHIKCNFMVLWPSSIKATMSNRNCLLVQKSCHYLNQSHQGWLI